MINELLKQIGRPYEMFYSDGNYQGCFYPVYIMYPDAPRYPLPTSDNRKNYVYGMRLLRQHAKEISKEELKAGDIIATEYRGELHVGIFHEFGRFIHVFKGHELQIGHLSRFKNYKCFRVGA